MAKAIPDYAIEVRDVSEEIAALREAVEVLEAMESETRIDAQAATSVRDYYLKNWEAQRDECARLSSQVTYYRRASEDWHKTAIERAEEVRRANKTIDTILYHATIRRLATKDDDLEHERTPKFWYGLANCDN